MHIVRNGTLKQVLLKCAVFAFRNEKELDDAWTWGDSVLPCNGHWDAHLKDLVTSGKRK